LHGQDKARNGAHKTWKSNIEAETEEIRSFQGQDPILKSHIDVGNPRHPD